MNKVEIIARAIDPYCWDDDMIMKFPRLCSGHQKLSLRKAQQIFAALEAQGYAIVPVEPTEAMFEAGNAPVDGNTQAIWTVYEMWQAMIQAAQEGE